MIIRNIWALLATTAVWAGEIKVRMRLCSDLHDPDGIVLGAESKGLFYMGFDTANAGAKVKIGKLDKLQKVQLGKRWSVERNTVIESDTHLRDVTTVEIFFFDKSKSDQLCLEMLQLEQDEVTIRLIQDYELWSVMPVGWTSKTRAKIMLFDDNCPIGVAHCRKSNQYIINADAVDECDLGMDVCDDNAACNNKPIGYKCVCNPGWVGPGIVSYDGQTPGCVPGTTPAPTTQPNPCLGNKKYHKIIDDRIITYTLFRTVKILYEIAHENVGLCASQCAAKDNCGGFNYLFEQRQCHLFREDNDKFGNWNGYKHSDGVNYKTMPAPIGSPAQVYIIKPICLCGAQYWKGEREKVCEAVYTTSTSTTSTSTTTTSTTSTTTEQQSTTSSQFLFSSSSSSTTSATPSTSPPTTEPTTPEPTTPEPTTAEPTTAAPTTADPTTKAPTTDTPTTAVPTIKPTTQEPETMGPPTAEPTTPEPTTAEPTVKPTTKEQTTPITETTPTQSTSTEEPIVPTQPPKPPVSSTFEPSTQTSTPPETTTKDPWLRNCDAGFQLATNVLGTLECLPIGGSIVVTECNHPVTGAVQITGKVFKGFDPRQPPGFITDPDDEKWWMRVFQATDPEVTPWEEKNKIDPDNLYLHAIVRLGNGAGVVTGEQVFVDTGHNYRFICKYPLDDQIITDGYQVSGSDFNGAGSGVGQLKYNVKLAANTYKISETVSFTIEPLSPGLVYARAMKCSISNVVQNVQVAIFGQDNEKYANQYCVNPAIQFTIGAGYGSMVTQNFSYMVSGFVFTLLSTFNL